MTGLRSDLKYALYDAYNEVACLMLGSMTPELHRQFENYSPYEMLQELKSMFEKQAGVERFDLIQTFHACKHEEGKPVGAYVLKMKDYVEQLEHLGYVLPQDLSVGLILNGLTSDFTGFVRNYNMHNMEKTIGELHAMLIEYEKGLPKKVETPQVMMIKCGKIQKANKKSLKAKGKGKANGKGKDKHGYISKPKNPKPTAKEHPAKDDTCHHCKEVGHWKRNYPVFLAELLKKKKQVGTANSSSIFTIVLFAFPNKSWVYDTGCGTRVCITKQGFRETRKLKQGALYLYVGNDVRAQVEAIGSFDLVLPNGLDYALESATRILNMVPTKKVDKTPYELWYGKVPNLSYLKVWGCEALVKRDTPDKLQQRSFFEKNLITQEVSGRAIDLEEIQDEDTSPSEITSEIPIEVEGFKPPQEEVIPICFVDPKPPQDKLSNLKGPLCLKQHQKRKKEFDEENQKCFAMKDLGEAAFILGIKIYRDRSKRLIGLSQNAYMDKILKRYKMDNSKRGHIPMQERLDLNKTQGASTPEEVKLEIHRPDELRAKYDEAVFNRIPGEPHWAAGTTILKYLRILKICCLFIVEIRAELRLMDWKSSKQSTTAMSATEAEYIAASEQRWKLFGLGSLFQGLSIALGEIKLLKVHLYDNLADPFTKALPNGKLTQHARSMGLRLASSFM
ncbi:zinc finger, CCHC-type containing protein [Tanacetum coccineum]